MVLVSKANKRKVYEYLLREGVIVIKKVQLFTSIVFIIILFIKDWGLDKHLGTELPNLQVWMILRSLESRGHVTCVFNW